MEIETLKNLAKYGIGASSTAILEKHLGIEDVMYPTPSDSSDLMRCLTIVDLVGIDINIMKDVSPQWRCIVDNWDSLKEDAKDEKNIKIIYQRLRLLNTL